MFEPRENVLHRTWRIQPGVGDPLNGTEHRLTIKVNLVYNELVWMFRLDVPGVQCGLWKILQILRNDDLGPGFYCCREDVPIVRVREIEHVDQWLVADDETVSDRTHHQLARPGECFRPQVGSILDEILKHLVENPVCPLGLHQASLGNSDEQVPKRVGVQHVGIVNNNKGHWSGQPKFLGQRRQLVGCIAAAFVVLAQVVQQ